MDDAGKKVLAKVRTRKVERNGRGHRANGDREVKLLRLVPFARVLLAKNDPLLLGEVVQIGEAERVSSD